MSGVSTKKNIAHITEDEKFCNICKELIQINFPSALFPEAGLSINALSIIDATIFKIISEESIPPIVGMINDDLINLKKNKSDAVEIYYLSKSKCFENAFYVKRILSSIQKTNRKINLLSYPEISKMLIDKKSYTSPPQFIADNISELFEKFFPSHNRFPLVFEEIVSFVYHQNIIPITSKKKDDQFLKLKLKIPVNFATQADRDKIMNAFSKYWRYKERVRNYFELNINTDPHRILSLLFKIQNVFQQENDNHEINSPVNYPSTFLKLAHSLIPHGKQNISEYECVALAIVYYFFEMCDFGERFDGEQLSIFQGKIKEYGPPQ